VYVTADITIRIVLNRRNVCVQDHRTHASRKSGAWSDGEGRATFSAKIKEGGM
jgi:hypothetical protein